MAVGEWLPLVLTSVSGTSVALAGVVVAARASKRQQETAIRVAREQAENASKLAREEREQRRLEEAYGALVNWMDACRSISDYLVLFSEEPKESYPNLGAILESSSPPNGQPRPDGFSRLVWSSKVIVLERTSNDHFGQTVLTARGLWHSQSHGHLYDEVDAELRVGARKAAVESLKQHRYTIIQAHDRLQRQIKQDPNVTESEH